VRAREIALELWSRHTLSVPVDLRRLAPELDLEVVCFPFGGRIKEVIIGRTIGVQPGLPRPWFRWYVAHAIGHHMLHAGTSFYLQSWQWVNYAKAERQAEEFATWLTGGPEGWRRAASELGSQGDVLSDDALRGPFGFGDYPGQLQAFLVLMAYLVVLVGAAFWRFQRRDVAGASGG